MDSESFQNDGLEVRRILGWYWILNRVQNDNLGVRRVRRVRRVLRWHWILIHFRVTVFEIAADLELNPLTLVKAGVRFLNR